MPDEINGIDRVVVPDDEKKRILDLGAMTLPVPDVGIYDGPVRYYKANLQWAKIIEGHVSWLASIAAWTEAEDEGYEAIQQILIFLEGIEAGMAAKEDIRDGIYEAFNRLALQVASGQYANLGFTTDENGILTPTKSDKPDVELPEDNPDTVYDETQAAVYGGTIETCRAIELFFDKLDAFYGNVNGSPIFTQGETQVLMKAYFSLDEDAFDLALTSYYLYRNGTAQLNLNFTAANQLFIYCHGSDYSAFQQWLIDSSGFAFGKINQMVQLSSALTSEFWNKYYTTGTAKPSTAYVDGACVPMKFQEHTGILYGVSRSLIPSIAKGGHRIENFVRGYYTDPDGDTQDAFWYRTAAGVLTRSNFTFTHGSGANNTPSDNQVPYSPTHEYRYTIDLETGNNVWSVQFNRNSNMNVASTSPTGGFSISITDLGQYTL